MQDIFIEFLPPWVETNLQPAFYDAESGTVLQQTARMYGKINELIASVNNMDKVIKEYVDYIDHYFENLDVQAEIDHKLDEMAEGGELAEYIAQYANLPCIHAYDTISDMASSENLLDGSFARAMSKTVAGTGDGFYYKIRTRIEADDPDGENLVAVGETLVAEKIPDYALDALATDTSDEIDSLQEQIDEIKEPIKKYLFVGDSYADGYTGEGQNTPWQNIVKTKLGLDDSQFVSTHRGGFGFGRPSEYNYYLLINALSDDPDLTDIVIGGSYNDNPYSELEITTGISNVRTLCKAKFPNATLHIAFIGWSKNKDAKTNLQYTYQYYKNGCDAFADIDFMKNTQYALHDYGNMFSSDGIHPNQTGQTAIANAICDCLLRGSANIYYRRGFALTPVNEGYLSGTWGTNSILDNGLCNVEWINTGTFNWSNANAITLNGKGLVKIADITSGVIVGDNTYRTCATIPCVVQTTDNKYHSLMLNFAISAGSLYIQSNLVNTEGTAYDSMNIKVIQVDCLNINVPSIVA